MKDYNIKSIFNGDNKYTRAVQIKWQISLIYANRCLHFEIKPLRSQHKQIERRVVSQPTWMDMSIVNLKCWLWCRIRF